MYERGDGLMNDHRLSRATAPGLSNKPPPGTRGVGRLFLCVVLTEDEFNDFFMASLFSVPQGSSA